MEKEELKQVFNEVLEPFAKSVQEDFTLLKKDVGDLKGDVGELKKDVGDLKGDVGELKSDVGNLKIDMSEVKADVSEMKRNSGELFKKLDDFISLYNKHDQEIASLTAQVNRLREEVEGLKSKL